MDFAQLAAELLQEMRMLNRASAHKKMTEYMQGESFALRYIAYSGGDVLPGELSSAMRCSSARVAAALNSLESKGLITRQIDTRNRRRILVRVTQAGRELAAEHQQMVTESAERMLRMLGEQDAREYVRITGKLAELLTNYHE